MRRRFTLTVLGAVVASFYAASLMPSVSANDPPTISVPDHTGIWQFTAFAYTVYADDPDEDSLRFTWDWGDGSIEVTTVPTTTHTYYWKGIFVLTVYADDLTGLPGHNVSDSGHVYVEGTNKLPIIIEWSVDSSSPYAGEIVTFTASAKDPDGDSLRFTFLFGDDTSAVEQGGHTPPNTLVTFTVEKSYDFAGWKTARILVDDGWDTVTTSPLAIDVQPNAAPVVFPLPDVFGMVDEVLTFWADAFDLYMDDLTYTWDFGDGTPLVVGNPVTHAYASAGVYEYRVWVDDQHGYNVTVAANATIRDTILTFNLLAGWNLVTVPLVNHSYHASTLGLSFADMISRWDSASQTYDKNYIMGISNSTSDFPIEPSWSYWIYSHVAQSIVLYGDEPTEPQSRTVTVPLGGGWVQAGIASLRTDLWASDLMEMYTDNYLLLVSRWEAPWGSYSSYIVEFGLGDFPLSPGDGLWLYVESSGVLSYDP